MVPCQGSRTRLTLTGSERNGRDLAEKVQQRSMIRGDVRMKLRFVFWRLVVGQRPIRYREMVILDSWLNEGINKTMDALFGV